MEVNITYETLFDTLRKERGSEELQVLEPNFYEEANDYLTEKINTYKQNNEMNTLQQIANIKKLLREIFERREKKILMLAFNQGRTNNHFPTNKLLKEEAYFFNSVLEIIRKYNTLLAKTMEPNGNPVNNSSEETTFKMKEEKIVKGVKKVKFLTNLPKFLGRDLESYGPYKEGDVAELPDQLAEILIDKKRAQNA